MRVAVLAHVRHPISPPFMGGMEAHAWHLADALVRRGHDVTLFASGDSRRGLPTGVHLEPVLPTHYDHSYPWHIFHGTDELNTHLDRGFSQACRKILDGRFDIIHNNTLHRYLPRLSRQYRIPMVTSLHIPPFKALKDAVDASIAPWCRFTTTSHRQSTIWWPEGVPPEVSAIYNGIDMAQWPFEPTGDGSAVWAGRLTATKGPHLAAQAAHIADVPLTLYGTIEDQSYFNDAVRPHLTNNIRYGGHLSGDKLATAYGKSSVLLFTPLWEEPFGLAAIEAMATGLSVASIDNGAVREVIGDAGAYATQATPTSLSRAILRAFDISPTVARKRVHDHFSRETMILRYEDLYENAIRSIGRNVTGVKMTRNELHV